MAIHHAELGISSIVRTTFLQESIEQLSAPDLRSPEILSLVRACDEAIRKLLLAKDWRNKSRQQPGILSQFLRATTLLSLRWEGSSYHSNPRSQMSDMTYIETSGCTHLALLDIHESIIHICISRSEKQRYHWRIWWKAYVSICLALAFKQKSIMPSQSRIQAGRTRTHFGAAIKLSLQLPIYRSRWASIVTDSE